MNTDQKGEDKLFLKDSIYWAKTTHVRYKKKHHKLTANIPMFYLELSANQTGLRFKKSRLGFFYHFREADHFCFGNFKNQSKKNLFSKVCNFMKHHNYPEPSRIFILTQLRVLGYTFNPVSFYFCFDNFNTPFALLLEVNNTYYEQQPYLIRIKKEIAMGTLSKGFYVSPFIDPTYQFEVKVPVPKKELNILIKTKNGSELILAAYLGGKRITLNKCNLLKSFLRFGFSSGKTILLIHWHAFLLYLKGVPFIKKKEGDLQISKWRNDE